MNLLLLFVVLNIVNVVLQTIRSLATVKCGKAVAAVVNAVAYGLYTVVIVYTACDLPLWEKVAVVGGSNLIGVYVVKALEERAQKDKIWLISAVLHNGNKCYSLMAELIEMDIDFTTYAVGDYVKFEIFSKTQDESRRIKKILDLNNAKYFATETKALS